MLFGWWRVKLSSGCPLATGLRPRPARLAELMAKKRRKRRRRRPAAPPPGRAGAERRSQRRSAAPKRRGPADEDERPQAPWGSFPLVELVVLVGLVMLVVGFIVGGAQRHDPDRAPGSCSARSAGSSSRSASTSPAIARTRLLLAGLAGGRLLALLFYAAPDALPPAAGRRWRRWSAGS